jgi:cell division protein FtsB
MKTLIGGAIAAVLGAIFLAIWWGAFLQLLAGSIPVMLLLGGCLALYLGFDELKDTWQRENGVAPADMGVESDLDKFKQENEELKKELDALKDKK